MKAIIMAGGEGTRLRPLTCDCPKPMMRLMDRPVMDLSFELLAIHGINEAAVTLGYLPERIRDRFGDSCHGVKLRYYTERLPLGTAGSVKQAADFITETFCVLSGDGVTDCDLTAALRYHRSTGAKATVVLKRMPDPTPYGLVITAPDGRILRFTEKPTWGDVVSDAVNTGIYIFEPEVMELIPDGPCDFGKQVLPALAEEGSLYGWTMDGYWCDIGDIQAYLTMCRDALDGRISLPGLQLSSDRITVSPGAHVHESAVLEAPCWIGEGTVIDKNAHIGAYSIIGSDSRIGENACIKRSVLWSGSVVHSSAQLRGCVLGKNTTVDACARIYENCALGSGARIGADTELAPGVSIWPGKTVSSAALIDHNLVWGGVSSACFHNGALPVDVPSEALRCAQACAAALRPREVLLGRTPSATASAMWHSCAAGLMAQGVRVLDAGICTEPQLRYSMELLNADCGLLAGSNSVIPLNHGLRLSSAQQRQVCALIARQDYPRPFSMNTQPVISSGRSDRAYTAMLSAAFCADPAHATPAAVHCDDPLVLSLAEQAFSKAGLRARFEWEEELMELFPGETGIWLSPDGMHARFSHANGMLTDPQNELLAAWTALERGDTTLIVNDRATRAINEIAARRFAAVSRTGSSQAAMEQALAAHPMQLRLNTDGIYFALCALSSLTENALTLTGWLSTMPKVQRSEKRVPLDDSLRGRTLRNFQRSGGADNLCITHDNACAWISPDDDRPECCIISESRDMEAARELCDFCEAELIKAAEKEN